MSTIPYQKVIYCCSECDYSKEITMFSNQVNTPDGELVTGDLYNGLDVCPSCGCHNFNVFAGAIEEREDAPAFSYSAGNSRINSDSRLKEKFQQIHALTPGSKLDQASTITKI